jgi:hypothetical protein
LAGQLFLDFCHAENVETLWNVYFSSSLHLSIPAFWEFLLANLDQQLEDPFSALASVNSSSSSFSTHNWGDDAQTFKKKFLCPY